PVASLVAAILHANNIRDVDLDLAANKRTLANQFGRRFANIEFAVLVFGAYVATVVLVATASRLWPTMVVLLTLPTAIQLTFALWSATTPPVLNTVLRKTAGLHLQFGLLLTIGLICSRFVGR
ncbi:MAG: prenyltransferase, partial [Chloroflexota bacterium]|nr:prenyltransferase [Chloroflexota bacterium]